MPNPATMPEGAQDAYTADSPGLCGCCDSGCCNCLGYLFCACCHHMCLAEQLEHESAGCFCRCMASWCCLPGVIMTNRIRVGERVNPKVVESASQIICCTHCCLICYSCQTIQLSRQVPGLIPWEPCGCCEKETTANEPVQEGQKVE